MKINHFRGSVSIKDTGSFSSFNLEKGVVTQSNIDMINIVLDMISNKVENQRYNMSSNNISLEERLFFKEVTGRYMEVEDLKLTIMRGSYRFIYVPKFDDMHYHLEFTRNPITNDTATLYNTFIIGDYIDQMKSFLLLFISDVIMTMINKYINECLIHQPVIVESTRILDSKVTDYIFAVNYFITLFKMLDAIMNLKYADFMYVKEHLALKVEGIKVDLEAIYKYAITSNTTEDDYKDLLYNVIEAGGKEECWD